MKTDTLYCLTRRTPELSDGFHGRGFTASLRLRLPCLLLCVASWAEAQLFTNLQSLGTRLDVGDPTVRATNSLDGPKGIVAADFNLDQHPDLAVANTDGTVTLYFGKGEGQFGPPHHLRTEAQELRGIVAADFTGEGRTDIAVAAPYAAAVFLFVNEGIEFSVPRRIGTWDGARNLAAGDFDGDGRTDLVVGGTTNGLRQLRALGGGEFVTVTNLVSLSYTNYDFPKPLYVIETFRPAGRSRDELVVTHADADRLWILTPRPSGLLEITGELLGQDAHAVALGAITQRASSNQLDLVTASRDFGTIEVHRGMDAPSRFEQVAAQRFQVPGGPRALAIADLDRDGWNDLAVVLRNFDRVLTYRNSNGVLVATTEMPVGQSPREIVAADFNGDGRPDVAVMNRGSQDLSVLLTYPGQTSFGTYDQIYPVDGEISGLAVLDFNRDGRDDVVQLHRASGEFSVRLAGPTGLLGQPTFFPMGALPSAQAAVDVNNDGITDIVTANLGRYGTEAGSVSVRLGDGQGGFGPERRYYLPSEVSGSLFALVAGDFDRDGNVDLAAGFFDCRLSFFKGNGQGGFTFTKAHLFVYESRVMVTGDFDGDGDLDLAGAGYAGDVVVIENKGDLLTTSQLTRFDYPATSSGKFGTRDIVTADVNGDGDLDLLVGSGDGTMLFFGLEGMGFFRGYEKLPGTDFPASGVTLGDFDGDGSRDVAVSCRILSCVSILVRDSNGLYRAALSVDVPAGEFLASGDLDGDGKSDLVGSGSVLWTALSGERPRIVAASVSTASRPRLFRPVVNEFLAINTSLPVELDGDRFSDWVELFNGDEASGSLNGWKLRLVESTEGALPLTNEYTFPPTAFFPSKGHLTVICSEVKRTLYHTGFRLPGAGGTLLLLNNAGLEVDRIVYPAQQENVSMARYRDGSPALVANPYPSPGRANTDNGPVEPTVKMQDFGLESIRPGQPIRFYANARDDVGVISLSLLWQRLDVTESNVNRVVMYDDGMHEDAGLLDGLFSGLLEAGLPAGAEIQFYIEAVDLSGQTVIEPDDPVFTRRGAALTLYSLAVAPNALPQLEISEVVAWNTTGLRDGTNGTPDWVEIRNYSTNPTSLRGVSLAQDFFGNNMRYRFADTDTLAPGEHRVIYCDGDPARGPLHAPFAMNRAGDRLVLTSLSESGARRRLDGVSFGAQAMDVALARLGQGGFWRSTTPTPRSGNVAGVWEGIPSADGTEFTLGFPTVTNRTYAVEFTGELGQGPWTTLPRVRGDGIERAVSQPMQPQRFFRVRVEQ